MISLPVSAADPISPSPNLMFGMGWLVLGSHSSELALVAVVGLLVRVWGLPAEGDISRALTSNPEAYTLSLGHMGDLTVESFAYLRLPLGIAGIAFLIGAVGGWMARRMQTAYLLLALMMVFFFHAARVALIRFDPYLGSRELAESYVAAPAGELIVDNQYYAFSSVFFYANASAPLLTGG